MQVTVGNRRTFFAGFVEKLGKERLPRRVMFGRLIRVKGYRRQENDQMVCLEETMAGVGMEFEGCNEQLQRRPVVSHDRSRRG